MTPELLSLVGGSFVGFLFRYIAEKRAAEAENFKRLIEMNTQTTNNQNLAAQRVPIDAGKVVRRLIVLIILFGTIIAPFILPFFGIPTIVEVDQTNPELLFGLVPETSHKVFQVVNGFLFTNESRQVLISIIGFYFGTAAAGNKS
ncbi:MAG: hypothetical protein ACOYNN_09535 [Terrimicrobiaceae bacterium]